MLQITHRTEEIPVYDFTVDDNHNFYCNGALVHNCGEIILRPQGFCNLTEVVVREGDSLERLKEKVEIATILGTFQSTLTNFRYLRSIWKKNAEEERLLGVSLTGIMDHPVLNNIHGNVKEYLTEMRNHSVGVNKDWAEKLGINPSAAITTVKPSGCTTLDTEIRTTDGVKSMAEIFSGVDELFEQKPGTWIDATNMNICVYDDANEIQPVTKLFVNGMSDVFVIELEDGNSYEFTGNHKLKTINGWKRVDELTVDDDIVSF